MSIRRPRILFVSPTTPYPLDAGVKIRVRNMLESVALVGDVDFIGYSVDVDPSDLSSEAMLADIAALCRTVRICQHPPVRIINRKERLKILRRYFLSSTPAVYADFPREPLLTMIEPLAREADMIWVERLCVAHWLRHHGAKTIVDVDDLDSVKIERELTLQSPSLMRKGQKMQVRKLRREEEKAVSRFSRLAVCSAQDHNFWPEVQRNRVWLVPNGADDRLFDYPRGPKSAKRIVFVGTMSYEPNVDAARFFCREILPRIAQEIPDVSFWIVGKDPCDEVLRMHDNLRVKVVADVPDIAPYVQQAALSVVPLRVGGGTRLKILESLALGTPVISTTIGAEGLELVDGRDLVLADSPEEFSRAVLRLLRQEELYHSVAEAGFQIVSSLYRWTRIRGQVAEHLRDCLEDRARVHD